MGRRGKAARKRRRDNEVNEATATIAIATKLVKKTFDKQQHHDHDDGESDADADADTMETGMHDISDATLETTVATLHRLFGLVDPATGKLALKDKRYRSLRKVLYELQSSSGVLQTSTLSSLNGSSNSTGVAYLLTSESAAGNNAPHHSISSSKMTREISAQIENGAYELAVTTLRNVRKLQEEHYLSLSNRTENGDAKNNENGHYLQPKLGAVQRWVRQIDAAGTNDPLALEVLDAILRVVAPECILPVEEAGMEKATWSRLGVNVNKVSSGEDGNHLKGGKIRLFSPFDRRLLKVDVDKHDKPPSNPRGYDQDCILNTLVTSMVIREHGIRQIQIESTRLNLFRDNLFRQCGYEKGGDRRPPNKYDLEIVTTASIGKSLETVLGKNILLDNEEGRPIVKTPLPYVQDSFLIENVLSPAECDRMLAAAETAGYRPDEPLAGQPGASILAHACVWVVDHKLERTIFERVKDFLPSYKHSKQKEEAGNDETFEPLGLNRRFRFYRYIPGRYYRPHIDGAWPASGFDGKGNYRYDICDEENKNGLQFVQKEEDSTQPDLPENIETSEKQDDQCDDKANTDTTTNSRRQLSRLTFLIYLNDDFDGGHTTFLVPAKEKEGILNAFPVSPVRGGVLVFPHGTCAAPLHEGSPVLKGCKYVVRTEVEYYV